MSPYTEQITRWIIKLGGEVRSLQDCATIIGDDVLNTDIKRCEAGLAYIYQEAKRHRVDLLPFYQALADIEGRLKTLQFHDRPRTPSEKIALFIDAPNLSKSCSEWLGRSIDFAKLLTYFTDNATLLRAYYYTGIETEEALQSNAFLFWLKRNGYRLVTKQIKTFSGGERKGNLDVDIAVDMLELVDRIDRVVLFSGDGDFATLLDRVGMKGVKTQVVAYWGRGEGPTARELIDAADVFVDLADIIDKIARD